MLLAETNNKGNQYELPRIFFWGGFLIIIVV